jgi:hypothetical protein
MFFFIYSFQYLIKIFYDLKNYKHFVKINFKLERIIKKSRVNKINSDSIFSKCKRK